MGGCSSCGNGAGPFAEGGPFSKGRELVEFVSQAHGGVLKNQPIPGGGLETKCQGCGEFTRL